MYYEQTPRTYTPRVPRVPRPPNVLGMSYIYHKLTSYMSLYLPVTCNPSRAVTLPNIAVPRCIEVPHRVTYPYRPKFTIEQVMMLLPFGEETCCGHLFFSVKPYHHTMSVCVSSARAKPSRQIPELTIDQVMINALAKVGRGAEAVALLDASIAHVCSLEFQPSTLNLTSPTSTPSTHDPQPSTLNPQPQHSTLDPRPSAHVHSLTHKSLP